VPQQLTSYVGLELLRRYLYRMELARRRARACAHSVGIMAARASCCFFWRCP